MMETQLFVGTSSWTADGWVGSFYPPGCKPADFLPEYAKHFNTVEVDSTFYRIPSAQTVKQWSERTPRGFVFAAKVPQTITRVAEILRRLGCPTRSTQEAGNRGADDER